MAMDSCHSKSNVTCVGKAQTTALYCGHSKNISRGLVGEGVAYPATMSSAGEPECTKCHVTSSPIWRRNEDGAILCLECHSAAKKLEKERSSESTPQPQNAGQSTASGNHSYKKGKKGGKKGGKGDKNKNSGGVSVQVSSGANKGIQKSRRTLYKSKVGAIATQMLGVTYY